MQGIVSSQLTKGKCLAPSIRINNLMTRARPREYIYVGTAGSLGGFLKLVFGIRCFLKVLLKVCKCAYLMQVRPQGYRPGRSRGMCPRQTWARSPRGCHGNIPRFAAVRSARSISQIALTWNKSLSTPINLLSHWNFCHFARNWSFQSDLKV